MLKQKQLPYQSEWIYGSKATVISLLSARENVRNGDLVKILCPLDEEDKGCMFVQTADGIKLKLQKKYLKIEKLPKCDGFSVCRDMIEHEKDIVKRSPKKYKA